MGKRNQPKLSTGDKKLVKLAMRTTGEKLGFPSDAQYDEIFDALRIIAENNRYEQLASALKLPEDSSPERIADEIAEQRSKGKLLFSFVLAEAEA